MLDHTSDSILFALVRCTCGHDVGKHAAMGCTSLGCDCTHTHNGLIDLALEAARIEQRESLMAYRLSP
jgi:hypothetical protein